MAADEDEGHVALPGSQKKPWVDRTDLEARALKVGEFRFIIDICDGEDKYMILD